jgi:hypothetical protein
MWPRYSQLASGSREKPRENLRIWRRQAHLSIITGNSAPIITGLGNYMGGYGDSESA